MTGLASSAHAGGAVPAGRFARFYLPLAATSLLLTATNPILAAALARTAEPANVLAGYSVAFALAGVLYSPLLVVQQVAASRMLDGGSLAPVRRFALLTGAVFSAIAAAVAFTPLGVWVFGGWIGIQGAVLQEALDAIRILWPVPLLTAVRSVHQGRLVAGHHTKPIATATGFRTGVLAVVALALALIGGGAWIGAVAFLAGLIVETVLVAVTPADVPVGRPLTSDEQHQKDGALLRFTAPLMINVLLWWSTPLIINAVLARTPYPALALAGFAVIEAFAWFVAAPVGQLQHACIALVDCTDSHRSVRRWAVVVAAGVTALLGVLSLPGVREPLLRFVFGLSPDLVQTVGLGLPIAALYPLLYGHRQYYQGLMVRTGKTDVVGVGALLRVGSILAVTVFAFEPLCHLGVQLGVGLAVAGLAVEGVFLLVASRWSAIPVLRRSMAERVEQMRLGDEAVAPGWGAG